MDSPKILIISDIHVHYKFEDDSIVYGKYLSKLVSDFEDLAKSVTHILICGDLVFSGKPKEFEIFHKTFIEPILIINEDIVCIPVFGNHDVYREAFSEIDWLRKYYNAGNSNSSDAGNSSFKERMKAEKVKFRDAVFGKDLSQFNFSKDVNNRYKHEWLSLSEAYREYFTKYIEKNFYNGSILNSSRFVSYGYLESNGLVGSLIDNRYGIVFNTLNSAWFAVGSKELFKAYKSVTNVTNFNFDVIRENSLWEQGNLNYLNLPYFNKALCSEISDDLQKNLVVTLSHHPYSYCKEGYSIEMQEILENTDFFITGHIHNQPEPVSIHRGKCFHIESPQLFDYKYLKFKAIGELVRYWNNSSIHSYPGYCTLQIFNENNIEYSTFAYSFQIIKGKVEIRSHQERQILNLNQITKDE